MFKVIYFIFILIILCSCVRKRDISTIEINDLDQLKRHFASLDTLLLKLDTGENLRHTPSSFFITDGLLKTGFSTVAEIKSLRYAKSDFLKKFSVIDLTQLKKDLDFLILNRIHAGRYYSNCGIYLYSYDSTHDEDFYDQKLISFIKNEEIIPCVEADFIVKWKRNNIFLLQPNYK